jgi:hypothetical protein
MSNNNSNDTHFINNPNNSVNNNNNNNNNNKNNAKSVTIPTEILLQIFSYLNKDYISLYNCLLVNKFWYINVIGILYSNPFNLLLQSNTLNASSSSSTNNNNQNNNLRKLIIIPNINYSIKRNVYNVNNNTIENRIVKLIDLYIKCLKICHENDFKEIEKRLNDKGIFYIYNNDNSNDDVENQDQNGISFTSSSSPSLLLDYSSYLRYLRYDDLFNFTSIYLNSFSHNTFQSRRNFVSFFNNNNNNYFNYNFNSNNNNCVKKSLYTYNPYSIITKRTIVMELFKKFLNQRKNLIELSLNTNFINDFKKFEMNYFNGIDQDLFDIFNEQTLDNTNGDNNGDDHNDNNIRTLICGGIKFDEILKLLQNNLKLSSIKNFIIDFNLPYNFNLSNKYYISSNKIVNFLSLQKNLKKLCVIGRYYELYDIFFKLSQHNILKKLSCLEFYGIVFNNNYLTLGNTIENSDENDNLIQGKTVINEIIFCHNLQELVFEDCVNLTSDTLFQLRNSKFTSLKKFTFRNCSGKNIYSTSSHNSLAILIKNNGKVLEEIRFGRKLKWFIRKIYDVGGIVLEEMMRCENLKVIEFCVLVNIVEEFLELLRTCKTLEKIIISIEGELSDNELFWKRFGNALNENRNNLDELSICIGGGIGGNNNSENELWIEMFEWFFNSCDIPINILKFPMCHIINENYLKIIENYAKRVGGIKKIMLCEGIIRRKNSFELKFDGVQCLHICSNDVEFGDDDLIKRIRFRNNIQ